MKNKILNYVRYGLALLCTLSLISSNMVMFAYAGEINEPVMEDTINNEASCEADETCDSCCEETQTDASSEVIEVPVEEPTMEIEPVVPDEPVEDEPAFVEAPIGDEEPAFVEVPIDDEEPIVDIEPVIQEETPGDDEEGSASLDETAKEGLILIKLQGPCEHEYEETDWVESTCCEYGYIEYTCIYCDDSYIEPLTELAEHDYEEIDWVEGNCKKVGYYLYECQECGKQYKEDDIEGSHELEWIDSKESTCTKQGYDFYKCTICNMKYYDYYELEEHDYEFINEVESTCTKKGYDQYKCTACGHTYKEEYDLIDHDLDWVRDVDATCEKDGYSVYKCTMCKQTFVDDYVDAYGHDEEVTPQVDPECGVEGKTESIVCGTCGKVIKKATKIPALAHIEHVSKESKDPTCEEEGWTEEVSCELCGKIFSESKTIAPLGHSVKEGCEEIVTKPTCLEDGLAYLYGECEICMKQLDKEEKVLPALGHDHGEFATVKKVDATYESDGYILQEAKCSRCEDVKSKKTVIPKLVQEEVLEPSDESERSNETISCETMIPEIAAFNEPPMPITITSFPLEPIELPKPTFEKNLGDAIEEFNKENEKSVETSKVVIQENLTSKKIDDEIRGQVTEDTIIITVPENTPEIEEAKEELMRKEKKVRIAKTLGAAAGGLLLGTGLYVIFVKPNFRFVN